MTRKYTTDIERLIFDLLFQKNKAMPYSQIYNSVKEARNKLSYETFDIHLDHLQTNGLLEKTGKCYFLSDKAYFLHRLKILEFSRPSQAFLDLTESQEVEKRLKMHLILSYFGQPQRIYHLQSRQHFEDFLSRHRLSENDLRPLREDDSEYKGHSRHIKEFFADRGIAIRIVEEKLKETLSKISYHYFLPGFSISDILKAVNKKPEFFYLDPARSDLQEEIDMLVTEGLMERIGELDNEIRYRFSEQFVWQQFRDLYDDLFNVMFTIWAYLRSPKKEEKKWLEFFYGNVEGWLQDLRHNRSSNKRKKMQTVIHITESMPEIHKGFEDLIGWHRNQKNRFFIEKLLEYIYPVFMRKSFSAAYVERRSYATSK